MDPITAALLGLSLAGGVWAAFKSSSSSAVADPNAALIGAAQKAAADAQKFFRGAGSKLNKFGRGVSRQANKNYHDVINAPLHAAQDAKKAADHAGGEVSRQAKKLKKKLHL